MRLALTSVATADLDEVWLHIAMDDPTTADEAIDRIWEATSRLTDFPELGRARSELRAGLRSLVVDQHLAFYTITEDEIQVLTSSTSQRIREGTTGSVGRGFLSCRIAGLRRRPQPCAGSPSVISASRARSNSRCPAAISAKAMPGIARNSPSEPDEPSST